MFKRFDNGEKFQVINVIVPFSFPSSFICNRTVPTAYPNASTSRVNGAVRSGWASIGSLVTHDLRASKAVCSLELHCHMAFFRVRRFRGRAKQVKL